MVAGTDAALHRNLPGPALFYMAAGVASFSLLDAAAKYLTADYGVAQIIFLGRIFTLVLVLTIAMPRGGARQFGTRRPLRHLARAVFSLLTMATFFWALSLMPLANVVALAFAAPLMMTILSVVMLREKVRPRRWSAVAVGLIGVLVILRPTGEGFTWVALIPLSSALFYALSIIVSRQLTATESTETLMLWVSVAAIVGAAPFVAHGWVTPDALDLAVFAFTGIASGIGQYFMVRAFRYGEVSLLAPIEYSALIWAALLGFLIWGEIPGWSIWIGAVIVAGSSIYIARRESRAASPLALQARVPGEGAP